MPTFRGIEVWFYSHLHAAGVSALRDRQCKMIVALGLRAPGIRLICKEKNLPLRFCPEGDEIGQWYQGYLAELRDRYSDESDVLYLFTGTRDFSSQEARQLLKEVEQCKADFMERKLMEG